MANFVIVEFIDYFGLSLEAMLAFHSSIPKIVVLYLKKANKE